jgi:hypothetical protein
LDYFAPGGIKETSQLAIVEGEFKALSIYELGIGVIGLCGLYVYKRDEEGNRTLLPEINQALARSCAEKVYIADADTATNLNFARSAQFLADKLSPIRVLLPRLRLDGPKGFEYHNQIRKLLRMAAEARISDEPAVAVGRLERLATKLSGVGRKEFNRSLEQYLSQEREKQDRIQRARNTPRSRCSSADQ